MRNIFPYCEEKRCLSDPLKSRLEKGEKKIFRLCSFLEPEKGDLLVYGSIFGSLSSEWVEGVGKKRVQKDSSERKREVRKLMSTISLFSPLY